MFQGPNPSRCEVSVACAPRLGLLQIPNCRLAAQTAVKIIRHGIALLTAVYLHALHIVSSTTRYSISPSIQGQVFPLHSTCRVNDIASTHPCLVNCKTTRSLLHNKSQQARPTSTSLPCLFLGLVSFLSALIHSHSHPCLNPLSHPPSTPSHHGSGPLGMI